MTGSWTAVTLAKRYDLANEGKGGQFGPQHLQRDLAVVPRILGEIDGGHAAFAETALDAVAIGEGRGEPIGAFSHGVRPSTRGLLAGWKLGSDDDCHRATQGKNPLR
jgi:hypothetical protein